MQSCCWRGATCQAAHGVAHQAVLFTQGTRGGRVPNKAELTQKLSLSDFRAGLHRGMLLNHIAQHWAATCRRRCKRGDKSCPVHFNSLAFAWLLAQGKTLAISGPHSRPAAVAKVLEFTPSKLKSAPVRRIESQLDLLRALCRRLATTAGWAVQERELLAFGKRPS